MTAPKNAEHWATVTAAVADVAEAMQMVSEDETFSAPYYALYRLRTAQDALARAVEAMGEIARSGAAS